MWFDVGLGMRLPRKARTKLEHCMRVLSDCLINLIMMCNHDELLCEWCA